MALSIVDKKITITQGIWLFVVLIISISGFIDFINNHNYGGDWMMYMNAARAYSAGLPLYHVWIKQVENMNMYLYSPFFSFILVPITFLPSALSLMMWYFFKIILLYRIFIIAFHLTDYYKLKEKQRAIIITGSFLFATRFLLYDFDLGQITLFLLWTMVEGWYQLSKGRNLVASFLFALGIFIKILSIIFIPYLIYKKKFRTLTYFFGWTIIIAFIPFIAGRWSYNMYLLKEWLTMLQPMISHNKNYNATTVVLHDLFDAVPAWYSYIALSMHRVFSFQDPSNEQLRIVVYILMGFFGVAFLYLAWLNKKIDGKEYQFSEMAYLAGCIPIIFPFQQKYSYVLIIPLIIFMMNEFAEKRLTRFEIVILVISFILMVLTTDGLIGRHLNYITQQLKLITIGGILLLALLLYHRYLLYRGKKTRINRGVLKVEK